MTRYVSFESDVVETSGVRRWLWPALVASLLLHLGLVVFFNFKKLENFGAVDAERLAPSAPAPRIFVLSKFEAEEGKLARPEKAPVRKAISIPETKPQAPEEWTLKPDAGALAASIVLDRPQAADFSDVAKLEHPRTGSGGAMEKELGDLAAAQLEESVKSTAQPAISIGKRAGDGDAGDGGAFPGRLSLSAALCDPGAPISGKAIAMHGGALFEWSKAELRPEAVSELRKLGELIKRYPRATLVISGHTDHTGTHEGNVILSQQRADAVRDWLVANFGIDPARITTIGKADDEAFQELGPERSIDEQALNRRVEIRIRTHGE